MSGPRDEALEWVTANLDLTGWQAVQDAISAYEAGKASAAAAPARADVGAEKLRERLEDLQIARNNARNKPNDESLRTEIRHAERMLGLEAERFLWSTDVGAAVRAGEDQAKAPA